MKIVKIHRDDFVDTVSAANDILIPTPPYDYTIEVEGFNTPVYFEMNEVTPVSITAFGQTLPLLNEIYFSPMFNIYLFETTL